MKPLEAGIRPSCDCITAEPSLIKLKAGASQDIIIKVDTEGYSGLFDKQVYVQANDNEKPYSAVRIFGEIEGNTVPQIDNEKTINDVQVKKTARVVIFASPGCGICKKIESETMPEYAKKYGIKVEIRLLSLDDPKNYEKLLEIEKRLGKPLNKLPIIYAGGTIFSGKDEIVGNLDNIIKNSEVAELPVSTGGSGGAIGAAEAASKLKGLPVILAGLVDSINPCAFATIVFFLSYMSLVLKKSRLEVFLAGVVFIIGVYVTYFFIGIGIFSAVLGLTDILKYSKILYLAIGIFVLYLAARHIYEAALLKKTGNMDDDEVKMKLPGWIRRSIEKLITRLTGLKFILPFVFLLAVIITLLELVCTGQVYLPAIIYLTSIPQYRMTAYIYLAFYCFLFVVPLIVIFGMYYFGMTTLALKRFFKDNIVAMKVTMGVFFITLAVFMIAQGVK